MYSDEQMKQFERDREFIAKGYEEHRAKNAGDFSKGFISGKKGESRAKRTWFIARYRYPILIEQRWIKLAIIILCFILLLSMFLPWFGKSGSAFFFAFTDWSYVNIVYLGYKTPLILFTSATILIIYCAIYSYKRGFPENSAALLSFPVFCLLPFLLNLSSQNSMLDGFISYNWGFKLALFTSVILAIGGFVLNRYVSVNDVKLPANSFFSHVKQFFYYGFIFIGMFYACELWNNKGQMINTRADFNWLQPGKYLLTAAVVWILFYKHQFIRVWFHLIAFYAFSALLFNLLYKLVSAGDSNYILTAMSGKMSYAVAGAFLLSYYIGLHRRCPSCRTLFGKKLISYSKNGSTSYNYKDTESKLVRDVKFDPKVPLHETLGKKDSEYIDVEVNKTKTYHHYSTENICKHCGNEWQDSETHTQWWYRPQ